MTEFSAPKAIDKSNLFRKGDPDFMTSLARGIEVIRAFSDTKTGVNMSAISERTGLSRAVARRCLYTLSEMGYVRRDLDGYYLEPKILSLSQTYFSSTSLPALAQEHLDHVKESTGESCSLAILDEHETVYITRSAARRIMAVSLGIGSRLPAYCTSLGRVLLAALPPAELDNYFGTIKRKAFTERTRTTQRDLKAIIDKTREQGFTIVDQELEIGLRSLAVPVRNHNGVVVAAMNVGVQASRVSLSDLKRQTLPVLLSASEKLRSQLIC